MIGFKKLAHKVTNLLLALFIVSAQLFAPISAIVPKAYAANEIVVSDHEGQLKPSGTYSNGNIKTYTELESINFRFTLDSSTAADGTVELVYGSGNDSCAFFDDLLTLGTHDSSAPSVVSVSGAVPTISKVGAPIADGEEWIQVLNVDFAAAGEAVVNYYLTLTDEAGDCSGSSTHTQFGDTSGDFKNAGAQAVSIPANDIIELAAITVTKNVDSNGDGVTDRLATAGEWQFSLNGGTPVSTNASGQVTFSNLATGDYTVTEHNGPAGQTFLSGSGTNCTFTASTATANVVAAPTAVDATCVFNNGVAPGKITIIKNAVPNNLTDFGFTATGTGISNFTLDDDSGVSGADSTFSNEKEFSSLAAGDYVFTESAVSGWDLTAISCPEADVTKDLVNRKVTIHLNPGDDVTCTFENKQRGQVVVTKQTLPDGDSTEFPVTISGTGTIHSTATQNVTDNNSVTYTVGHGTFDVNETVPSGWSVNESECQDLVINGNTPLVNGIPTRSCTITNTKLAVLIIIKDALPNHEQDFAFTTSGAGLSGFSLDDDSDGTLPSQQTFSNLTPGQQYSVTEQPTAGWSLTGLSCDDLAQQGNTASVTPAPGQTITCTFTNTKLISVSGTKYTSSATGGLGVVLSGWTIYIDSNNNGVKDDGELSDITDINGDYSFENLLYNTTIVLREVLQSGWTQIFGPSSFTLDSAQDVTDKDFGNFENATISGFKWNDKNADDIVNEGEEKLNGWTITLYNDGQDQDTELDDVVTSAVTAGEGVYSFTNLAPGTYAVCETQQGPAWVQTYPNDNGCHAIVIDESNESNQANFGNQGRGTITVNKNVDTDGDGDGDVDITGATDWTWDIAGGAQNTATGSSQNVAAGTYTISEDQKANYHVVSVVCDTQVNAVSESAQVVVAPGANVTCTFTNARDTATITINKVVNPTNDSGKFDLNIDGIAYATDVGHGGTTGAVQVPTGTYTVSETAGTGTSLSDYQSSHTCVWNGLRGGGDNTTSVSGLVVEKDDSLVCTFTNTRLGRIIVEKQTDPNGSTETFEFDTSYDFANFPLSDGQQNDSGNLLPGTYSVAEIPEAGWDLTSVVCSDQSDPSSINLSAGETVTCVFTNTQDANIVVVKQTDPDGDPQSFNFTASYNQSGFSLSDGQQNDSGDLAPGTYSVSETVPSGWDLESATCSDGSAPASISLQAGETVTCTFNNQKDAKIIVVKQTNPDGSTQSFDFTASYDGNGFSLSDGQSDDSGDLAPGTYSVSETVPSGWDLKNTTCDDGSSSSAIELSAGEIVTCTFTNEQDARIVVVKQTNPDGSQQAFSFNASYDNDGFNLSDGQSNDSGDLDPGTYSVSETVPAGWDLESATCDDGSQPNAIDLSAGETVTCTFTNEQDANIVVVKQTLPDGDEQTFDFEASYDENGFTLGDGEQDDSGDLDPGTYSVSEDSLDGWDLNSATCSDESHPSSINLSAGETVTCTFVNHKRATVTVTKYNDYDRDGEKDDNEPVLPDWEFTLEGNDCDFVSIVEFGYGFDFCDFLCSIIQIGCYDYSEQQTTGEDGTATFTDVKAGVTHELTETPQEGWYLSNMRCEGDGENYIGRVTEEDSYYITPNPGENIQCEVGNYRDAYMLIEKANNRPEPVNTGEVVTYTITVTVPEDSNPVYDATVTDLPPEGFEYIPGSETATKGSLASPYASPGIWSLGDLFPGEVVVLTYQARIANSVSPGTYPDLAFASGCDDPQSIEESGCAVNVYANVTNVDEEGTPFVGTEVTIKAPQVLAANVTVLVNTGTADIWRNLAVGTLLMGVALATLYRREQKGGRA